MLQRLTPPSTSLIILLMIVSLCISGVAEAANTTPITVGTIPDKTLKVNETYSVDLESYFDDEDGDTLTYTATSGDTVKATVSVSNATLTVTAVAVGSVTIEATATDPDDADVTQEFTVTVKSANKAPTAKGTIPNFDLMLGASGVIVDASLYFSDEDVGALEYTVASSNTAVVTLSLLEPSVTVNHVGVGTATITITATDSGGLTATQTFSVTVTQNQAPTVGTIPAQVVALNGTRTIDLDNYFSDADGQMLIYSATSSNTSVATVSMLVSNLTITGKDNGTATVTVTGSDTFTSVSQTIAVSVKNPPTAVGTIPNQGGPVGWGTISVNVSSYFSDPDGQALTYSASSSNTQFASVSVSSSTVNIFPISAGNVTITVTATNPDGLSATQSFSVTLTAQYADAIPGLSSEEQLLLAGLLSYDTLIFNELHNASDNANDWLELRNVSGADFSLDDWQLTIRTGSGDTVIEFPAGTVIPVGEVLLLVNTANPPAPLIKGETGASVVSEAFALPQTDFALLLRSPTAFGDIAGNYYEGERPETAPALTVDTVWYRSMPTVSGYRTEAWTESTTQDGLGTPGYRHASEMADLNNDGVVNILDLVLVASQFGTTDTTADLNADGAVNIQDLVMVANALGGVAAAPAAHQSTAGLVNTWLRLARQNETVGRVERSKTRHLPEGFSYERGIFTLEQLARTFVPETTALLANYPNPFNPETWIPYQLSKATEVTVTIYATDGSVVRTLALGHQDAGMYKHRSQAAYWDGRNALGETVASGIYFYTLSTESTRDSVTAGTFTATRKMLILK